MYTLNAGAFGGALMNGLGQVRVFQTREDAEAYMKECEDMPDLHPMLVAIHTAELFEEGGEA